MWSFSVPEQGPKLNAYAASLYARLDEASLVPRTGLVIGAWQPTAKACHDNATMVNRHDSRYVPVRGWLYFDFGGYLTHVKFLAHSVVRSPSGELLDITPTSASASYPFVAAEQSEEDYMALVHSGVTELWHRK